jgi:entericidin B
MKIRVLLSMILLAALAAGCSNTFRGAGQDIERGGEKIQEKAS